MKSYTQSLSKNTFSVQNCLYLAGNLLFCTLWYLLAVALFAFAFLIPEVVMIMVTQYMIESSGIVMGAINYENIIIAFYVGNFIAIVLYGIGKACKRISHEMHI
ncbi:hypothetical protein [Cysteiniphilum marinum]|uniref:hypothetical protein n=1 Tax=Cysteiniphilum marinum TaxID=2774191 RepID=UPI00193AA116|nr:hypothetical protein [Cysteiniphilum marinum]